jgi:hypothetical protein
LRDVTPIGLNNAAPMRQTRRHNSRLSMLQLAALLVGLAAALAVHLLVWG